MQDNQVKGRPEGRVMFVTDEELRANCSLDLSYIVGAGAL